MKAAHSAGVPTDYHSPPTGLGRELLPPPSLPCRSRPARKAGFACPASATAPAPAWPSLSPSLDRQLSLLPLPSFRTSTLPEGTRPHSALSLSFLPRLLLAQRILIVHASRESRRKDGQGGALPPALAEATPSIAPSTLPLLDIIPIPFSLPLQPRPPHSSFSVPCPNIERGEREEEEEEEKQ